MKSVALHNLGCKVNAYEIEVMQQNLQQCGYQVVPFDAKADIYIVNTCTVTNMADRKSRQMLHRAKKQNPDAVVVAVGCYVQAGAEEALRDASVDLAIGNNRKKDIVKILEAYLKEKEENDFQPVNKTVNGISVVDIAKEEEYEDMTLSRTVEHTRAYIKIQDGCNQFCSYCIIPFARGRVRSRRQESVLEEIRGLVKNGYREVVVTGIHLSSYGLDWVSKQDGDYLEAGSDARKAAFQKGYLISLLEEIQKIEGLERIRLGSLEPRIITEEFARRLKKMDKFCPHFHLSLQSGCDETLKRMNRHYSTEEYYEKVQILRSVFENPAITTDVIVGFPGETEEEFARTREYLKQIQFFEMHIFKYSRRQGTVAAQMKDQVSETEKTKRSNVLIQMEQEDSRAYREKFIGNSLTVLVEEVKEIDGRSYWLGHTERYVKAAFPLDAAGEEKDFRNRMVTGTAEGFLTDEILLLQEIR